MFLKYNSNKSPETCLVYLEQIFSGFEVTERVVGCFLKYL